MDHLRCVVERITYQNPDNGYSVIKCRAKNYSDLVTVVGSMAEVHVGSVLTMEGFWRVDAKYGRQFSMQSYEETLPATVYGIEKYLGSGLIKGVGPKFARRIVQKYGAQTLNVIEDEPDRLLEVEGIGRLRVERIKKGWQDQKEIKNIMLFLQGHDVSTSHATKIFRTYGNESISIVQENPYRLADDIWGIGFKTADQIAEKLGFGHEKYVRIRSGILYTLNRLSEEGHCFSRRDQLIGKAAELLGVEESIIVMTLDEMMKSRDLIVDWIPNDCSGSIRGSENAGVQPEPEQERKNAGEQRAAEPIRERTEKDAGTEEAIYLPPFFFAENGTARRLKAIRDAAPSVQVRTEGLADRVRRRTGMQYDEVQEQAILAAVENKILVLTGGPGTGKTTTTLGIIAAFREAGARILLAAPTGRAAKRLSEVVEGIIGKPSSQGTGKSQGAGYSQRAGSSQETRNSQRAGYSRGRGNRSGAGSPGSAGNDGGAKTIHRLLEVKPPDGYQRNEEDPLEGDVLIVDECSMIDILLMYNLLKAVPDDMRVIFVGDVDQLPSVGAGNVLADMIHSGAVPVIRLTRIFRQAQGSRIILNAHRINRGGNIDLRGGKDSDFFFSSRETPEEAADQIVRFVSENLPRYYHADRVRDIQVLTPMQRGVVGAVNLNQRLQEALNRTRVFLKRGGTEYRLHDKVMQIRNDYDKEVFNGDIGFISGVDMEERELKVDFDGRQVVYDVSELDELVLAYACTIHKSQGSEYPIVVMPFMMTHYIMLQRNLLYTGVTRAKKILVLVGERKALQLAIRNNRAVDRNTLLAQRLQAR